MQVACTRDYSASRTSCTDYVGKASGQAQAKPLRRARGGNHDTETGVGSRCGWIPMQARRP